MKGSDIKADAQGLLQESGAGIRWTDALLLPWINSAGRDIYTQKPKAGTVRQLVVLTQNVTKQPTPANTVQVLDLVCNMGTDGATPGRAITTVAVDRLAAGRPGWRADKGDAVRHLVVDDRDPTSFIVWPAPKTAMQVEALLSKQWTDVPDLTTDLPIDSSYRNAMRDYVLHMAYAMEGEDMDLNLSAAYYTKYAQTLGIQIQKQKRASAPANSAENPAAPAVDKNGA